MLAAAALSAFLVAQAPCLPAQSTSSASSIIEAPPLDPAAPLVVNQESHIVVMEYEAWFGPHGITFQTSVARPLLQSKDMQAIGGGYDSADPAVIKQHVAWMESLGVDAAIADLTNDVSCIFNSEWFVEKYLQNFGGCPVLRGDY